MREKEKVREKMGERGGGEDERERKYESKLGVSRTENRRGEMSEIMG